MSHFQTVRLGVTKYHQMRPECMNKPGSACEAGLELEILSLVANMLKIKFEIKTSLESGCGHMDDNGTWTGLLGMIERNEIDLIGNLCGLDENRINALSFQNSRPVLQYKQNFLIKAPEPKFEFSVNGPFEWSAWFAVFVTLIFFMIMFTAIFAIFLKYSLLKSLNKSTQDVFCATFGMDVDMEFVNIWLTFICFIGSIGAIYSSFVTAAMLKPEITGKPFKNSTELADALYKGRYRILDYKSQPYVKCDGDSTCSTLDKAIKRHGFHIFPHPERPNGTNLLLNELLLNPNLVLVKGRYQLRIYLSEFAQRSKLWLLEDESSGEEWSVYFFRKDFTHKKLFNEALIKMGTAKDNLRFLYFGLSYQAKVEQFIKGEIPKNVRIDMKLIYALSVYYGTGLVAAMLAFIFELICIRIV